MYIYVHVMSNDLLRELILVAAHPKRKTHKASSARPAPVAALRGVQDEDSMKVLIDLSGMKLLYEESCDVHDLGGRGTCGTSARVRALARVLRSTHVRT